MAKSLVACFLTRGVVYNQLNRSVFSLGGCKRNAVRSASQCDMSIHK